MTSQPIQHGVIAAAEAAVTGTSKGRSRQGIFCGRAWCHTPRAETQAGMLLAPALMPAAHGRLPAAAAQPPLRFRGQPDWLLLPLLPQPVRCALPVHPAAQQHHHTCHMTTCILSRGLRQPKHSLGRRLQHQSACGTFFSLGCRSHCTHLSPLLQRQRCAAIPQKSLQQRQRHDRHDSVPALCCGAGSGRACCCGLPTGSPM